MFKGASGLTRQETIILTGVSSSRLSYLDSTMLVCPEKFGSPRRPIVVYGWDKILEIKIIDRLRGELTLQSIRKIAKDLDCTSVLLSDSRLVFLDGSLYVLNERNWKSFGLKVLAASNRGQVYIRDICSASSIIDELRAKKHKIIDFDKRVIGTPLEFLASSEALR
jgi:DNA-binding transcriptional MerR regulator